MRICLFQVAYPTDYVLPGYDSLPDPGRFLKQHTFHHRPIDKNTARNQIDVAVAEGFDFYFNFMWGQPEDEVAGVEATEYLESLDVPFIGLHSRILRKSNNDFFEAARKRGGPPVPSNVLSSFPVIVKAAQNRLSQFLSAKTICFTADESSAAIAEIDRRLQPGRLRSSQEPPPGQKKASKLSQEYLPSIHDLPGDIILHEFVPGTDYSVAVIEFGTKPIALKPTIYNYPPDPDVDNPNRFLTFDLKFNRNLTETLLKKDEDPVLFDLLQATAIEAYEVNGMAGGSWGSVDIRIKPDGKPVVIEIDPMPAIFLTPGQQRKDPVIQNSLPGGHRALLNIVLATYFMQLNNEEKVRLKFIASEFDKMAPKYDLAHPPESSVHQVIPPILSKFDFSGSLLDLACGTGIFGRLVRAKYHNLRKSASLASGAARHVGIDISPEMARLSEKAGYDQVLVGSIQEVLPNISETFDHISSYSAIHFVSSFELSLVLSRCFQIAKKSITIGVDEIPDEYNEIIRTRKSINLLTSINHLQEMRDFGVPIGWKLALEEHYYSWKSPSTGVDVFTTLFHYQRNDLSR